MGGIQIQSILELQVSSPMYLEVGSRVSIDDSDVFLATHKACVIEEFICRVMWYNKVRSQVYDIG